MSNESFVENVAGERFAPTLPALLRAAALSFGEQEFLTLGDKRVSFAETERVSGEWARGLLALGSGKASRIALLMPNAPDWVIAFMACARAGALTVPLSTFYQAPELAWGLAHNDVETLLVSARYLNNDYLERLERAIPGLAEQTSPDLILPSHPYLRRIIVWGDCDRPWALRGPDALTAAAAAEPRIDADFLAKVEANVVPADAAVIICTSGSTAEPKAVIHTHGTATRQGGDLALYNDVHPGDRLYSGQPMFWIGGLVALLPAMFRGGCICFSETPTPEHIARTILDERVTVVTLWPAQIAALMAYARPQGIRFPHVRTGLGAPLDANGKVIPPDQRFGGMLGMTESFGMHSMEAYTTPAPPGKAGTWGRGTPGIERRVVDPETGVPRAPGEIGELQVRGRNLMAGYYRREREATFLPDGFFATGDLVTIDEDGYLDFHGRGVEMVKTSGANVSPREVELALQALDGVQEAIVFGLPDPIKGEIVAAYVVPEPKAEIDPDKLRQTLREQVSPYKVPQKIRIIPYAEVPRTGSQKAIKPQLKQMFLDANARDQG